MKLLPDTRNVLATFFGIGIVLSGTTYVRAAILHAGDIYQDQTQQTQRALAKAQQTTRALTQEVTSLKQDRAQLEQQLVRALDRADKKEAADALRTELQQQAADAAKEKAAEQAAAQAQAEAQAQAQMVAQQNAVRLSRRTRAS